MCRVCACVNVSVCSACGCLRMQSIGSTGDALSGGHVAPGSAAATCAAPMHCFVPPIPSAASTAPASSFCLRSSTAPPLGDPFLPKPHWRVLYSLIIVSQRFSCRVRTEASPVIPRIAFGPEFTTPSPSASAVEYVLVSLSCPISVLEI